MPQNTSLKFHFIFINIAGPMSAYSCTRMLIKEKAVPTKGSKSIWQKVPSLYGRGQKFGLKLL